MSSPVRVVLPPALASTTTDSDDPRRLAALAQHLRVVGAPALSRLSDDRLLAAWNDTIETFLDAASPVRRRLDRSLAAACRLSSAGLADGLALVLAGVARHDAEAVFARARAQPVRRSGVVLVVLASNLPGLVVQPLLPALARRRPLLVKSARAEPHFAAAFIATLVAREPALGDALAVVSWRGGDRHVEAPLLAEVASVIAYGGSESTADLAARAPGRVLAHGAKLSLAIIGAEVAPTAVAVGLARDVALFDQRGCLSVQSVYTDGDAVALARALADALTELAHRLPPGPILPAEASAVQQLRAEAEMRGLARCFLALGAGTVLVEPRPELVPSPGLRTVRVMPLSTLDELPALLSAWRGRLQGVALAGAAARELAPKLEELGVTRTAPPGELQAATAGWQNAGVDPVTWL